MIYNLPCNNEIHNFLKLHPMKIPILSWCNMSYVNIGLYYKSSIR